MPSSHVRHQLEDLGVVGQGFSRELELFEGSLVVEPPPVVEPARHQVKLPCVRAKRSCAVECLFRKSDTALRRIVAHPVVVQVRIRERNPPLDEARIEAHRALLRLNGSPAHLFESTVGEASEMDALHVSLVRFEILGRSLLDDLTLATEKRDVDLGEHALGDIGLHVEDLFHDAVVALGPNVSVVGDADELRRYPNAARALVSSLPAHRAFEDEVDIELVSNRLRRLVGVGEVLADLSS
ncbi:MAG: hypothetical protein BMS9Abin37_1544 [Acidobacteriota bacterium]|nr:MAG: hypothetical protein BMS9Abin37_1544 [Acidobacteriota bacterium]